MLDHEIPPLVSALCASRPRRWGALQRAILDFCRQAHVRAELVIAVQDSAYAEAIGAFITAVVPARPGPGPVKVFQRHGRTAADLLMYAAYQSRGDYVTLWDDDNQNAPDRLAYQLARQRQFPPGSMTALAEAIYHFPAAGEAYVVRHDQPTGPASERCLASTLMLPRDALPHLNQFRPHPAAALLNQAAQHGLRPVPLRGSGLRHLVGVAGDNLRGHDLHRRLATTLPGVATVAELLRDRAAIAQALDAFRWDSAAVAVRGRDGPAFDHTPTLAWPGDLYPVAVGRTDVDEVVLAPVS